MGGWLLAAAAAGFATSRLAGDLTVDTMAVVIVAEVYALLVASLLIAFRGSRRRGLGLASIEAKTFGVGLGVWATVCVSTLLAYGLVSMLWTPDPSILDVLAGIGSDDGRLADANVWTSVLILGRSWLLAPLAEELLFRGALFGWLRRHLPAWPTIAVTAALWALIHQVPVVLPLAFVVGIAAGWLRERTGSTIPLIVAHALTNIIITLAALILTGWTAPLPL